MDYQMLYKEGGREIEEYSCTHGQRGGEERGGKGEVRELVKGEGEKGREREREGEGGRERESERREGKGSQVGAQTYFVY